ncbi:hypothetical protein [uncultured Nitratireductor sp.]|uniref:hypothetical protein n=1 Tax=uncultured Nitratireductor sp. TaxID=520953 RepID=UPI0025E21938|nr:hypothetical protein [uncultured Nitratireductor sp.]
MSDIRPLEREDIPAVAEMFQRILRGRRKPAPRGAHAYLESLFLDPPHRDDEIRSLVHLRDDGSVNGFMGVLPMPFTYQGQTLRGAIAGSFMVDGHEDDPYAGARLLRAFQSGPQDLCLTETANDVSTAMWRKLRGTVLTDYSLEWLRVIRPAGFVTAMAAAAFAPAAIAKPLARPFDALLRRRGAPPQWTHVANTEFSAKALATEKADIQETAALFKQFAATFALHPKWTENDLQRMVSESGRKTNYGTTVRRKVLTRGGKTVGLFLYYGDRGGIGRVIQILAQPGHEGAIIDTMLADATDRGLTALRGRGQPGLVNAMLCRRFAFLHASSSIVYAKDKTLVEPFLAGNAFFNGFAGESWSRLLGDRFD